MARGRVAGDERSPLTLLREIMSDSDSLKLLPQLYASAVADGTAIAPNLEGGT